MKKYQSFLSENFQFLEVKFSVYLDRCVFLMNRPAYPHNLTMMAFHVHQYILQYYMILLVEGKAVDQTM